MHKCWDMNSPKRWPTRLLTPAVMVNQLGDLWSPNCDEPDWSAVLSDPRIKLHLYGKRSPRPGRKMGHFTCLDENPEVALAVALATRSALGLPDHVIEAAG